jgi:hypothetical protein
MRVGLSMPQLTAWETLGAEARDTALAHDMQRIAAGLKAVAARQAG